MKLNILAGILIGFSIAFLIKGVWTGDFDWGWWITMLIGGTIGGLIFTILVRDKENGSK
ncbi:hypothetical protein [Thalassobacillus devorans]|uniref:hypothetical protein n=1 Tax=Thalassobacillus devorans TaxID=279813 RepID=UPI00159491FF|nr:hypothetical protein [Thalassobacillus devorans]